MGNNVINKILVGIIAVIGLIFYIMIMRDPDNASVSIDLMLRFTYFVLGITVLVSIWVWIKEMMSHPEKLKQTALIIILFLLVVAIAKFVLASKESVTYYPNIHVDANTSNWIDTGLFTFYILGILAVLLMFLSPVLSMFAGKGSTSSEEVYGGATDEAE